MRWNTRKIDRFHLIAVAVLFFATGLRIVLAALGWPRTNSDEGTMAIMALNIAYHGDYPPLFYGQDYMGALEAYLGAAFFHLAGGPSLFLLRLGVILLISLFFLCLYLLTSRVFSRGLAIVTLLTLSLGSSSLFMRHIIATGGSAETLLFGTLAFLLAFWLALTYKPGKTDHWRLVGYASWGGVIGLGFWSDMVVLPFFAMAGLLLLLFCWRELFPWRWSIILLGLLVGVLPLLIYDFQHGINPFKILSGLTEGSNTKAPRTLPGILHNIGSTIQISIPIATGQPFCPVMEVSAWGDTTPLGAIHCIVIRASWGGGYLVLLGLALVGTIHKLSGWRGSVRKMHSVLAGKILEEQRQELVCLITRLFLLGGAALAIVVYMFSSGPVDQPGFHARYLVSLLIATPAILAPLWETASRIKDTAARLTPVIARISLGAIWILLLAGTVLTLLDVPRAQDTIKQRQALIAQLTDAGITRFYTDYWTCYDLIVESREQVICAVLDPPRLQPTHNRAPRYLESVRSEPEAALVFRRESVQLPLVECQFVQAAPMAYQRYTFGDYVVYRPILDGSEQPINLRQAIGPDGVQKWRPECDPATAISEK